MNAYFVAAAALTFAIGLVHSILGERLVFQCMRKRGMASAQGNRMPAEPYMGIIWASWHIVTILGWCIAVVLLWLAEPSHAVLADTIIGKAVCSALLSSSALVLVATKGRHPGWAGLLVAALLVLAGMLA